MKNLKRYSVFMLALIMLLSVFAVPVNADVNNNEISIASGRALGDINGDGKVSVADARICLRVAASLDKLTSEQFAAADVFNNGKITVRNARYILRCAARLGSMCYADEKEINIGDKFKTSGFYVTGSGQYTWQYTVDDPDAFSVDYESVYIPKYDEFGNPIIGRGAEEIFTFTALKAGKFTIHFEQKNDAEYKTITDFYINVVVRDPE